MEACSTAAGGAGVRLAARSETARATLLGALRVAADGALGVSAAASAMCDAGGHVAVGARARYLNTALAARSAAEERLGVGARLALRFDAVEVEVGYDAQVWLDGRASTLTRVPNPEHRLEARAMARF
jgi:hypothetical protein